MTKSFRKISLFAGAIFLVASAIGVSAGYWNNSFPIVGGSAFSCGSVNGVSNCTVPAGPALTGNETFPADTNLSGGRIPQTVQVPARLLGVGPYVYNVPVTTDSITIAGTTRQLIVNPAGTIAALTVVTPAASELIDGQRLGLCTTQIVTALTVTAGSGTTVSNAPTALLVPVATGAGSCVEWLYRAANTTWYRTQ